MKLKQRTLQLNKKNQSIKNEIQELQKQRDQKANEHTEKDAKIQEMEKTINMLNEELEMRDHMLMHRASHVVEGRGRTSSR